MAFKRESYVQTVGRRKTSSARVRFTEKKGASEILVNNKTAEAYFRSAELVELIKEPLILAGKDGQAEITVLVNGGGIKSQAGAVRHGIARALLALDEGIKSALKVSGLLTRDPREKERKKPGLKRARKRPQWSKR